MSRQRGCRTFPRPWRTSETLALRTLGDPERLLLHRGGGRWSNVAYARAVLPRASMLEVLALTSYG